MTQAVKACVLVGLVHARGQPKRNASLKSGGEIASSPIHSSALLVGTVGGAVTFVLIHADEQALPSAILKKKR